jgi:hypothetical protein
MRDFATNEAPFDYVGSLWQAQGGLPSKTVQSRRSDNKRAMQLVLDVCEERATVIEVASTRKCAGSQIQSRGRSHQGL